MNTISHALCSLAIAGAISAQDWPAWRGPNGDGVSNSKSAPLTWDKKKNVKWVVPLAHPANGSPIVSNGRVFLTTPEDEEGKRRSLYCYDKKDGKELWVRTVDFGKVMPTHKTNPYGGTTPAADGERVVVWHASAGLYCYDFAGKELWKRDFGEFKHQWGYGTSPVIDSGRVLLNTGPGALPFVIALDIATGETIWKTDEPVELDAEAAAKKRLVGSWCTPLIHETGGRRLVLCGQPTRVIAYDFDDGAIAWFSTGMSCERGDLVYSSPVVSGDICMFLGGYVGPAIGVRLGGGGDVTQSNRVWRHAKQPSNCGSAVTVDGHFYVPDMRSYVSCIDPATGKATWTERVDKAACWGSVVHAAGRLYLMTQRGTTIVFAPNADKFELLAKNVLAERTNSTPAIADGEIFLRTHENLYCIAETAGEDRR